MKYQRKRRDDRKAGKHRGSGLPPLKEEELQIKEEGLQNKKEGLRIKEEELHIKKEGLQIKEEELHIKQEEEEELQESLFAPVIFTCVKAKDDEDDAAFHQRMTAQIVKTDCEEHHEKVEESEVDSDWSWEWEAPLRQRTTVSKMEPKPLPYPISGLRPGLAPRLGKGFQFVTEREAPLSTSDTPVAVKMEDDESGLHRRPSGVGGGVACSSDSHPLLTGDSDEDDEDRPHKCSFCCKSFKNISHLNQHLMIHSGDKPFSCSLCGRAFLRSRALTEHIRTHTGEKPFRCSVCKHKFTSKARMKKHMKIHTGEKPFSCPFCSKCFVQRSFLVIHVRQHTGEKPFSCPVCHRSYTDKGSLRKHKKKHCTETHGQLHANGHVLPDVQRLTDSYTPMDTC